METNTHSEVKPASKTRKRILGLFLIAIGLGFGYFFIYRNIEAMQHHEEFSYYLKAMVLVPFAIVFGLYYVVFTPSGSGAWKDLTPGEKPPFVAALVLSALATVGMFYWFNAQLVAYGYESIF